MMSNHSMPMQGAKVRQKSKSAPSWTIKELLVHQTPACVKYSMITSHPCLLLKTLALFQPHRRFSSGLKTTHSAIYGLTKESLLRSYRVYELTRHQEPMDSIHVF